MENRGVGTDPAKWRELKPNCLPTVEVKEPAKWRELKPNHLPTVEVKDGPERV